MNETAARLQHLLDHEVTAGAVIVPVDDAREIVAALRADTVPPLASAADVATLLGVSRQRVHQLTARPDFPAPVARLAVGPVWTVAAIQAFDASWERRTGRPHKVAAAG